jgi:hypothetical protein
MENGPIFIGGLDQSGKTPLRRMLSAHPDLLLTRRTYLWTRFYRRFGDLAHPDNLERCLAAILSQPSIQELQPDAGRIRDEFYTGPPTYARLFELFYHHNLERSGKRRWGEQLGLVERFADVIFAAYPDAKMIHMIRDPRDVAANLQREKTQSGEKRGWSTARWRYSVQLALRNLNRYPEQYTVIRYEDLMQDTENTLRAVCVFLKEEYCLEMLQVFQAGADLEDSARRTQLPPSPVGQTRESPTYRQKAGTIFAQMLVQEHLIEFGYPIDSVALTAGERLRFNLVDLPVHLAGVAAWNLIEGKQFQREGSGAENGSIHGQ